MPKYLVNICGKIPEQMEIEAMNAGFAESIAEADILAALDFEVIELDEVSAVPQIVGKNRKGKR